MAETKKIQKFQYPFIGTSVINGITVLYTATGDSAVNIEIENRAVDAFPWIIVILG